MSANPAAPAGMPGVEEIGQALAIFFANNRQPCMSGDPRDRLSPLRRRDLDDAARAVIALFAPILAERERERDEARQIVRDIYWMALRYADGRQTYAPGMCNDALRKAYDGGWLVHRHQSDPAFARDGVSPEYRTLESRALAAEAALEKAVWALNISLVAVDDWLNIYASEFCDAKRVAQAHRRISDSGGTLAYIARVQDASRDVLAQIAAPVAAMED